MAEKILSECDGHDVSLTRLEKKVQQFEEDSTKIDPQEAAKLASELQNDIDVSKLYYYMIMGFDVCRTEWRQTASSETNSIVNFQTGLGEVGW